ncbi:Mandelate racemase/muconate lactonizing enzyme [Penicillium expansum]|uniref:Mandelate racemase/muconate lactonizing enzyme n=1 Tax=Penicillium expansum TaxID=27334 RepID=A0A0A2JNS4_PENEN|nr:Mandelate racemase/muconate lactonizing enzyme [Penicillium expansum]KGO42950.1 Mandelate racemase/muconate lactonizing enzyme [Penicillium expansum]KGO57072.1 Mandelate racemase/muconate lactonizing enzyme [Penicillium expansum]KGO66270.1 Mandelate racemase/muconate lactonizing enzyme [Penicillium expansum]
MRIISVNPYVIRGAHPSSSTQDPNWGYSCLVRIETDTGLVGWGEGTTDLGWGAPKLLERINTMFAPTLIGRDPTEPMAIWKTYKPSRAIDIALWDITGNAKGQPICKLLSSAIRSHIKFCVEVSLDDLWVQQFSSDSPWQLASATIPEAQSLLDLGFDTFQVKIEGRPESNMQVVRATREAFGRHASIVVENYNLNAPGKELVWAMSSARISLFVEAFKPHSKDNLRPSVPVAWGENEWDGKKLCEGMAGGGVDIL